MRILENSPGTEVHPSWLKGIIQESEVFQFLTPYHQRLAECLCGGSMAANAVLFHLGGEKQKRERGNKAHTCESQNSLMDALEPESNLKGLLYMHMHYFAQVQEG